MPRLIRLLIATGESFVAWSDKLCYLAMVVNMIMSGSILSLPFPLSIFFWSMLSMPRPTRTYWIAAITYTEVMQLIDNLRLFLSLVTQLDIHLVEPLDITFSDKSISQLVTQLDSQLFYELLN